MVCLQLDEILEGGEGWVMGVKVVLCLAPRAQQYKMGTRKSLVMFSDNEAIIACDLFRAMECSGLRVLVKHEVSLIYLLGWV